MIFYRSSGPDVFCRKDVLRNFTEHLWATASAHHCSHLIKKRNALGMRFLYIRYFLSLTLQTKFSKYLCTICGTLRDLVPFVQFKKREKHPWGVFCTFLNCTNSTKSCNASHMTQFIFTDTQ